MVKDRCRVAADAGDFGSAVIETRRSKRTPGSGGLRIAVLGKRVPRALAEEVRPRPPPLPPQGRGTAAAHQALALRQTLHYRRRAPEPAQRSQGPQSGASAQAGAGGAFRGGPVTRYPPGAAGNPKTTKVVVRVPP